MACHRRGSNASLEPRENAHFPLVILGEKAWGRGYPYSDFQVLLFFFFFFFSVFFFFSPRAHRLSLRGSAERCRDPLHKLKHGLKKADNTDISVSVPEVTL